MKDQTKPQREDTLSLREQVLLSMSDETDTIVYPPIVNKQGEGLIPFLKRTQNKNYGSLPIYTNPDIDLNC